MTRSPSSRRWSHLRQLGHTPHRAVLGPRDHIPSQRKLAAAARDRRATGLAARRRAGRALALLPRGRPGAAARLLAAGVTAIVCARDPLALGAVRAVRRAGLDVPDDVSVVGFDDSALMNCTDPPLTTVRQPIEPMGRMVIELLVAPDLRRGRGHATSTSSSPNSSCAGRQDRPVASRKAAQVRRNFLTRLLSSCVNLSITATFLDKPTAASAVTNGVDRQ